MPYPRKHLDHCTLMELLKEAAVRSQLASWAASNAAQLNPTEETQEIAYLTAEWARIDMHLYETALHGTRDELVEYLLQKES